MFNWAEWRWWKGALLVTALALLGNWIESSLYMTALFFLLGVCVSFIWATEDSV